MKTLIASGLFSLFIVLGLSAQTAGGGAAPPSGGGTTGGGLSSQSDPPVSRRAYHGLESNVRVDDREAYVEPDSKTAPYYPRQLREAGIKGAVVVEVEVNRDNSASNPRVIKSDHPDLDMLAIETVMHWKYAAAAVNGAMVRSRIQVEVKFDPDEAEVGRKVRMARLRGKPSKDLPAQYQYDEAPDLVRSCKAVYPYDLLLEGKSGNATVTFIVDPTGNARGAVVKDATQKEFGEAAAAMVEAWTFEPAMKDGKQCWALLTKKQIFNRISADAPIDRSTGDLVDAIKRDDIKLYSFAEVEERPKPIYRVGPEIPEALRKSGKSATAEIEFIIDENGRAQLPRILKSTDPAFGWAAATAVSRWLFSVPKNKGEPVNVLVAVPIVYEAPKK